MPVVADSSTVASRERVRGLFDALLDLPASERAAALRAAEAPEAERDEVRRLLEGHGKRRLFGVPAARWAEQLETADECVDALIGTYVDAFELVRWLGRGGSSVVYFARRKIGPAVQEVALKLLDKGVLSPDARRRFRREQALLSRLAHPNIAHLIDAGISDFGAPFIAMEYVEGMDLIAYAAKHRLDRRARVQLLVDTSRAVDAAHRSLIVHRDLKPSNVLVTDEGVVKVLDFGIAKLVDDDDLETDTQHIALTPAYAAPEQYRPGPVATSMDVFSLGVLSSELLLGGRLGADATLPPMETNDTWQRWRKLDGDLAHILRAALASEPQRRYPSAGHLADDFGRYLRREPIQVVPVSKWYRLRKFVSRHRGSVMAAALLSLSVVVGMAGVAYQAHLARQQAGVAQQQALLAREQAQRASEVRDFLVSLFKAGGADFPRDKRPNVETLVDRASVRLLADERLPDTLRVDLLLTLAEVTGSVGAYARAEALLARVDAIVATMGARGDDAALKSRVLRAGLILTQTAVADGVQVVTLLEPVKSELEARDGETAVRGLLYLANGFEYVGRTGEALDLAASAVARAQQSRNPELVLTALDRRASLTCESHRHREAIEIFAQAIALWERQGRPDLPVTVNLFGGTAVAKEAIGDAAGAEAAYRQAIAAADRFYDRDNSTTETWLHYYGVFLIAQSRADEAEPYLQRALTITRNLYAADDARILQAVADMATLAAAREHYLDAIAWATRAIDLCVGNGVRGHALLLRVLTRARIEALAGRLDDAEKDLERASQERAASEERDADQTAILDVRVEIQLQRREYEQALRTADAALAIDAASGASRRQVELTTRFNRVRALLGLHRAREALAELVAIEPEYAGIAPKSGRRFEIAAAKAFALEQSATSREAGKAAQQALTLASLKRSPDRGQLAHLRELASRAAD